MLKKFYSTEAEIPEAHKAFYIEKDGKWVLQVDGMVDADRLKEFRDKNIQLTQELTTLKETYKDVPADKVADFIAAKADADAGKTIKKEGFEEAVNQRVAAVKQASEKALAEAKAKADAAEAALQRHQVSIALRDAGGKFGLRKGAESDLESRGFSVLKMVDGKLIAHDPISGQPLYNPEDATPMQLEKWVEGLTKSAPHLFEESRGAGAPGSGTGGVNGPNPFSQKTFNLTEQGRIMRENPALAQRLKAAAQA